MSERPPRIGEVTPAQAAEMIGRGAALIDTREEHEWRTGHLPGATLVPPIEVMPRIREVLPDRGRPVVLYCRSGVRSLFAARQLSTLGYRDVVSMAGGILAWAGEGRPLELPSGQSPARGHVAPPTPPPPASREPKTEPTMTEPTVAAAATTAPVTTDQRYSRQLVMPEVGPAGQRRLAEAKVLVVGAGGLGSPALLYLAAAGVGTIGVVDHDVVEPSNLQRQVVHADERVGMSKTASAARALRALNPEVSVIEHAESLGSENVERLIAGHDVVIDGTDTFATRYLLNDSAVRARIPVIHASVYRFEGRLTVFVPFAGPCYRCLHPTAPPAELDPGCAVAGVLGVLPGVIGLLQATEAIKLILGLGRPLVGRLLVWDALEGSFSELSIDRDPACAACGDDRPRRTEATAERTAASLAGGGG